MNPCPPRDRLALLLAEQLSEAEAGPIEAHLETCTHCQETLAELASPDQAARAEANLHPPVPGRDPRPEFLRRLREVNPDADDPGRTSDAAPTTVLPSGSPAAAPAAAWTAVGGPEVPGYEVLGVLGRGGMGVVYKARQARLNRLVALKMILAGAHAGEQELARFRTEAEAVARLQHPNVVQIHEVGEHQGLPFFSLEFCPGGSLDRKVRGTPQPPREAARLAELLARAMDAAHRAGIIHRDLKPANVLLAADGTPRITDFGLAKKLDEAVGQTASGAVMGTPSYMAPEQAQGEAGRVGPAADVYALGAVLYELLTGRPPFKAATSLDTMLQVLTDEPVSPRRLLSGLPRDLETICLKCLAKRPAQRYASAGALADDLRRFLGGEPIQARPVGGWERAWKWCRRHPAVSALTAAVVLVAALGFGLVTWKWQAALAAQHAAEQARQNEAAARLAEEGQKNRAEQALAKANTNLYFYGITLAERQLAAHQVAPADETLAACPADLRRWEWSYLRRRCHADLLTVTADEAGACSLAFSPDGRRLACGGGNPLRSGTPARVTVWDAATGRLLLTMKGKHSGPVTSVAFSPDGTRLASASTGLDYPRLVRGDLKALTAPKGEVFLWDADTGKEVTQLAGCASVAFSPDGHYLATAGSHSAVLLYDVQTGRQEIAFDGPAGKIEDVAFSPDGKLLAAAGFTYGFDENKNRIPRREFKVWDTATRKETSALPKSLGPVTAIAFGPGGTLATAGGKGVHLWDLATGAERRTLHGPGEELSGVKFSADGQRLAASCLDGTVRVWDPDTGQEISTFAGHRGEALGITFAPPGSGTSRRLASAGSDGRVKVWDLFASNNPLSLPGHGALITGIALTGDGRRLASSSPDEHLVIVWDLADGRPLSRLACTAWQVAFSPDGTRLVTAGGDPLDTSRPGDLAVWDVETGRLLLSLAGHTRFVVGVAFSADGKYLVSGSADFRKHQRGEVKVWDTATWKELNSASLGDLILGGLAVSPDGSSVALAVSDQTVRLWGVTTLQELRTYGGLGDWGKSVAFSRDGRRLAAADASGLAVLWETSSGAEVRRLRVGAGSVPGLAFSPDGDRLVSAGFDFFGKGQLKVWDLAGGREVLGLPGLMCAAFSADGRRLVSAGEDHAVKIWDAAGEGNEDAPKPAGPARGASQGTGP
jgi:WD40 repeat protein/tRNA A-37 threonylcarbamoyl transferase component Bud32